MVVKNDHLPKETKRELEEIGWVFEDMHRYSTYKHPEQLVKVAEELFAD